jgi:hypothetical protein
MFFPGSATSWVFSVVPVLTWCATWTHSKMTWTANFLTCHSLLLMWSSHYVPICGLGDVVCDMYMSCGTSGGTCIWHVGHLARRVYVMWDILRNENCNQIQFVGDPLFCTKSVVTVGCSLWYHIWHYKLLGCVVHRNTVLTLSCLAISTTKCQMHVTYAIYGNKHERQVFHQTLGTDTKNVWNKCRPMLSKTVNAA